MILARSVASSVHGSVSIVQQEEMVKARMPKIVAAEAVTCRPPTDFETRLYKVCAAIPKGKVTTYGAMAAVLNSSPRAVGQALRRNPYAPRVPCHRVIAASLELGGFKGTWGVTPQCAQKRDLLAGEGVQFNGSKLASLEAVLAPDILASLAVKAEDVIL